MAKKPYVEPIDYFPKDIRKEVGLGEFNDDDSVVDKYKKQDDEENKKIRKFVKGE